MDEDGKLSLISSAGPTSETAACWVAVTHDGRFAYTTNAGSNLYTLNGGNATIGSFKLKRKGGLSALGSRILVPVAANGLAVR